MNHRQLDGKGGALAQLAFYLDFAIMQIHYLLNVGKTEAEALHVMHIAGMNAIELVEYLLQVLLLHSHARIVDGQIEMMFIIPCLHRDEQRLIRLAILHGIVHQIEDYILEMPLVDEEGGIYRLDIHINLAARMLHTE